MAVELYDEHEQGERVRRWIKEYGFSLIMGLVLAFAGIFGFRQWQDSQETQRYMAAEYFEVIQNEVETGNLELAEEQFEVMAENISRSAYVGLARMMLAGAYVEQGQLEPAAQQYRAVLDARRLESLWPVATLRLARILEAQGDQDSALSLLDGEAPEGFRAAWAELRGDLLFERGDLDAARTAYREALDNLTADGGNPGLIQLKLDATAPGLTEEAS